MDPTEDDAERTTGTEREATAVRGYYEAIDAGDYDRLASLLSPEFVHDRPDRTLSGRGSFVAFMREERPETDTSHEVRALYRAVDAGERRSSGGRNGGRSGDGAEALRAPSVGRETEHAGDGGGWVARGRLRGGDGGVRFAFVDVFSFDGGIARIETFVR